MTQHTKTNSLIYVIGSYPLLTTTFIDREIETLRQKGVAIQVVAMRQPASDTPLSAQQKTLQDGVIYLIPIAWMALVSSHLYFFAKRPFTLIRTLGYLLTRPHPGLKARLKTALHFGEGVYAAFLVRNHAFQELHAHFVDRAATIALVAGRLLNKPYSLSIHAGADIFVEQVLLPEKIGEARHIATCTQFNKTYLEKILGYDLTDKMTHIYHGLELSKYRPETADKVRRPLILSVGQLRERKGFHILIEACRLLKEQGYDFQCRIIGRGPEQSKLCELIERHALHEHVSLLGALPHEAVIDWYKQATLFVLPCIQSKEGNLDGFPNVVGEAMAMQVPVVSTRLSAIPELVTTGKDGLLVEPGDAVALSEAMAWLIDKPDFAQEMGQRARQTILERFDLARNINRFATTLWPEWMEDHDNVTTQPE